MFPVAFQLFNRHQPMVLPLITAAQPLVLLGLQVKPKTDYRVNYALYLVAWNASAGATTLAAAAADNASVGWSTVFTYTSGLNPSSSVEVFKLCRRISASSRRCDSGTRHAGSRRPRWCRDAVHPPQEIIVWFLRNPAGSPAGFWFSGARLCEPQQCEISTWHRNSQTPFLPCFCGSQTRAPSGTATLCVWVPGRENFSPAVHFFMQLRKAFRPRWCAMLFIRRKK